MGTPVVLTLLEILDEMTNRSQRWRVSSSFPENITISF